MAGPSVTLKPAGSQYEGSADLGMAGDWEVKVAVNAGGETGTATYHLTAWQEPNRVEPFRALHVDDRGWPLHGHLIWATATWWAATFEAAGFRRRPDLERELHTQFDVRIDEIAPARKAFFVFERA